MGKKQDPVAGKNTKAGEPDPETLGTTDPQEHMKGPISSMMQSAKEGAQHNDDMEREKAKHEHKKNSTGGDFVGK